MLAPDHIRTLRRDDLRGWVAERQRPIAALTASNEALRAELDQLKRGGKRQAAPFSKDTRVAEPKPPGRTPGAGTFRYRESPPPETSTEPPVDVRVWREACPVGGGPLTEERVEFASRTELRARPRPQVTRDRGWVCRGTGGGQPVRGEHPDGAPAQYGATAPRLGPRGMAAAQAWPEGVGLPVRKVPRVMAMGPGVQLTPGALPQAALRRAAGPLGIADEQGRASCGRPRWCLRMTPAGVSGAPLPP